MQVTCCFRRATPGSVVRTKHGQWYKREEPGPEALSVITTSCTSFLNRRRGILSISNRVLRDRGNHWIVDDTAFNEANQRAVTEAVESSKSKAKIPIYEYKVAKAS